MGSRRATRIAPDADPATKRRALLAVFLTIFVSLIGFGIVIPLLPFYAQQFQASGFQIGLLFASFSLAQLVASPILGDWSDRWGRRPVLIGSLIGSAVSFVMLAMAGNLFWVFLSRIVDGFTGGNITTARAYIADISDPKERARNFGLIGAAFGLGFILGPALGGSLAKFGLAVPAWTAAGISLVATLLAWWWLPETVHQPAGKRVSPWREMPQMFRRPRVNLLLWTNLLMWFAFATYQTTFPLFANLRFQLGPVEISYILAVVGFVGVVCQVGLVGRTVQRFGERKTLLMGMLCNAVGLMGAAFAPNLTVFYGFVALATVGGSLSLPSFTSILSQAVDPQEQGRLQGVSGSLESLARVVAPVVGNGALAYSLAFPYALSAVVLVGALGLAMRIPVKSAEA